MAGYEDPRYLKQVIEDLQKRLRALEGSALQLGVNQVGPLPGYMRAVQLNDVGQASSMWINMRGNQPGSSPYSAVTDANKTIRAEWGNLAANGISPAQFGFRANKADGTPIFDSLGLIAAASLLVEENVTPATTAGSGSGWSVIQTIPGSGANFALSRQGNILVLSITSVLPTAGVANYTGMYHGIWTQGGAFVTRKQIGAANNDINVNHFVPGATVFSNLAAGNYQLRQEFALDAGTTSVGFGTGATGVGPRADVIQLGG